MIVIYYVGITNWNMIRYSLLYSNNDAVGIGRIV